MAPQVHIEPLVRWDGEAVAQAIDAARRRSKQREVAMIPAILAEPLLRISRWFHRIFDRHRG